MWVGTESECSCLGRPEEDIKPLELEFKAVLSHLVWVLGTEHRLLLKQSALFSAETLQPLACLISERKPLAFLLSELVSKQKTSCLYYSVMSQLCLNSSSPRDTPVKTASRIDFQ